MRSLAGRFGLAVPEAEDSKEDAEAKRDRESLLKAHEVAAAWFREQLGDTGRRGGRGVCSPSAASPPR